MTIEKVRTALVTGASGALGRCIMERLSPELLVFGQYFNNACEGFCGPHNTKYCDLREEEQVKGLVEIFNPDVIIHAAGVNYDGMSWKHDPNSTRWHDTMAVNLNAAWYLTKYAIPFMRKRKCGRIIFMSSVVGALGLPGTAAYAASKAGLEALARAVAAEVAGKGITVNAIRLGYVSTEHEGMLDRYDSDIKETCLRRIPVRRFGNPDDVVRLIRYIVESPWMTGTVLTLDGGMTSCPR